MDSLTLILAFPLIGVLVNLLFGWKRGEKFAGWTATLAMALAFAASLLSWLRLLGMPEKGRLIRVVLFEWIPVGALRGQGEPSRWIRSRPSWRSSSPASGR